MVEERDEGSGEKGGHTIRDAEKSKESAEKGAKG